MGYTLDGVLNGVGEIIHGVYAPFVSLAVVWFMGNAVQNRVPHVEVSACKVDFRPQGHAAVGEFPCPHPAEQVKAFLNGSVPVGAYRRIGQVPPVCPHLLGGQLAYICQTLFYQVFRYLVHYLEIIGGIIKTVAPVIAQPSDVLLDGLHIFHVFLFGVGVVHPKVAKPAVFFGNPEINADCLGVPYVKVSVGLGRKTGVDFLALAAPARGKLLLDDFLYKVSGFAKFYSFFAHYKTTCIYYFANSRL